MHKYNSDVFFFFLCLHAQKAVRYLSPNTYAPYYFGQNQNSNKPQETAVGNAIFSRPNLLLSIIAFFFLSRLSFCSHTYKKAPLNNFYKKIYTKLYIPSATNAAQARVVIVLTGSGSQMLSSIGAGAGGPTSPTPTPSPVASEAILVLTTFRPERLRNQV